MSTIYAFQESETSLSVPPATADSYIVYSTVAGRTRQVSASMAVMAPISVTALTSNSTGTNILPYGLTTITSSNNAQGYLLSAPTNAGLTVDVVILSTSGATVTTSNATIITRASTSLVTATFNGVKGAQATLVALSTSSWLNLTTTTTANIAWS
jgi:hypothetical protein